MEETLIKRSMPNSLDAEQSVIGSMIMDKDAILTAMEMLTSDDFYQDRKSTRLNSSHRSQSRMPSSA